MSAKSLLLRTSSGIRSSIFEVVVVMVNHLLVVRTASRVQVRAPSRRPPGWNFPGTWSAVGRAGILRSVWYDSYYVNRTPDVHVVSRARPARARGAVDAVRPRAARRSDARQLLDLPAHPPV